MIVTLLSNTRGCFRLTLYIFFVPYVQSATSQKQTNQKTEIKVPFNVSSTDHDLGPKSSLCYWVGPYFLAFQCRGTERF